MSHSNTRPHSGRFAAFRDWPWLCALLAMFCVMATSGAPIAQENTFNTPHYFGDLNGDGCDDVLLRHTDGRWYYYPMNGREFLDDGQGEANLTRNLDWEFAGMGDLNGDGKDDVLVRRVTDGRWYYYPMDGRRQLLDQRGGTSIISDPTWQFAGTGDLNGDGKDDVLLRHRDDGRWYYYPMDGRRHLVDQRGGASIVSDPTWQLAGIGDLNGDGKDDMLLRQRDDGRWLYYPMDGREYIAGGRGTVNITRDQAWAIVTTVPLQASTEDVDDSDNMSVDGDDESMDGNSNGGATDSNGDSDGTGDVGNGVGMDDEDDGEGSDDDDDGVPLIATKPGQPGCNLLVTNIASNAFTENEVNSGNIGLLGNNVLGNRENYQSFLTGPDRNGYKVNAIKLPILGLGDDEVNRVNVSIREGQAPAAGSETAMANTQFSPAEQRQEQEQGMVFEYHAEDPEYPDSHVFGSANLTRLASGTWYHLAVSADGDGLRILGYTFSTEESSCFGWKIGNSSSWRIRDMTPTEVYDGRIGFRPLRFQMIGEKRGD